MALQLVPEAGHRLTVAASRSSEYHWSSGCYASDTKAVYGGLKGLDTSK